MSLPPAFLRALRSLGLALAALCASASAFAHAPDQQQIEHLDAQLRVHPDDADLLLRRAGVLHAAGRPEDAARDYQRVLSLAPQRIEARIGEAAVLLDQGRFAEAQRSLDACAPRDARLESEKWRLQTEIFRAQHAYVEAAKALDHAIAISAAPRPDDYLKRAELAIASGLPDEALAALDRGIARLNGAVALRWRAIDIAIQTELTQTALFHLDHLEKVMPGSALVRARRGDVFAACGHNLEASAAWTGALAQIESTPPRERSLADQSLAERLRRNLLLEEHP